MEDWALYRALHSERHKSWRDWEPPLRDRDPGALDEARSRLRQSIDELVYVQWIADSQWRKARAEANARGVHVLGDLPFMVAEDSSTCGACSSSSASTRRWGCSGRVQRDGQDGDCRSLAGKRCAREAIPGCASVRSARPSCTTCSASTTWWACTAPTRVHRQERALLHPRGRGAAARAGERILQLLGEKAEVWPSAGDGAGLRPRLARREGDPGHQGAALGERPRRAARRDPVPAHLRRGDRNPRQRGPPDLVGRPRGLGAGAPARPASAGAPARADPDRFMPETKSALLELAYAARAMRS